MIFILLCIILWVAIFQTSSTEHYDGIGKTFGEFHQPTSCNGRKNCYPGMYWRSS
jgi:hypothetical protein